MFRGYKRQGNPFVFDNIELLNTTRKYLEKYISKEIQDVLDGRTALYFNGKSELLFKRYQSESDETFKRCIIYLEKKYGALLITEKAFLEAYFYNDVQEVISYGIIAKGLFKKDQISMFTYGRLVNRLSLVLERGCMIYFQELEEVCAAYDCGTIWNYHYSR